ncbi:hypothetical protein Tco_1546047 [Tanacetum coccineum]
MLHRRVVNNVAENKDPKWLPPSQFESLGGVTVYGLEEVEGGRIPRERLMMSIVDELNGQGNDSRELIKGVKFLTLVNPKSSDIESVRNGSITKVEKRGNVGETSKDCRGVSRNVNLVNARNPTVRACYECGSTDHGRRNQGNQARGRAFMLGAEEARQDLNIVTGCSYKEFLACNPKEYDGKGGAVFLTRWIEKNCENVQDIIGGL